MKELEIFIQTGLCWLIIMMFLRYCVLPIVEIFTDEVYEKPIDYVI